MPAAAALLLPAPMRSDPAPNAARLAPAVAENVGGRKKRRIKAGVASGAPGQSHRPAVRVGATGCGNFGVAQKWGQNREGDITFAVNIPEALLSQGKNRGQSGNLPGFCSDAGLLIPPIPPQKLRRNETKKRRFRKAMRTKSWTGKGQECTHTRNGCEQSKHTSHPDIKRTRRSRSWDTHLTRRCVAGIGNIRKVEICTGISSGRLCIHRSKRRRRWPTIMPMGATIRKPLRPWDMSTGIVCGNGCWKRGRRRDRLVCRGEMS